MNMREICGSVSPLKVAVLILLAGCQQCVSTDSDPLAPPEVSHHNGTMYAACKMRPNNLLPAGLSRVYGRVLFKQNQRAGKLQVLLWLRGFVNDTRQEPRAVNLSVNLSKSYNFTAGHYNPRNASRPNRPGFLGNLRPEQGKLRALIESNATLFDGMSLIGRAVVVHEKIHDLGLGGDAGSLLHGKATRSLGSCITEISTPNLWDMFYKMYNFGNYTLGN